MQKSTNTNLVAYTTIDNIINLIDSLRRKNNSEEDAKAIFNKGSSLFSSTKTALRIFGIIEDDSVNFTDKGREIAYSQNDDKKKQMMKLLQNYSPYELFLMGLLHKDNIVSTEIDEITGFWGKNGFGTTERNRNDAAKLFMSIIEYCELGSYISGRGSNTTRIEWAPNIKEKIETLSEDAIQRDVINQADNRNEEGNDQNGGEINIDFSHNKETDKENDESEWRKDQESSCHNACAPNIVINVDMTNWPEEKIRTFFQYAYGKLKED